MEKQLAFPQIHSWVPEHKISQPSFCGKFNVLLALKKYSPDQYSEILKNLDPSWTKEETDCLWELIEDFEGNFVLVKDRWPSNYTPRTIEDFKERMFAVIKALDRSSPMFKGIKYNKEKDRIRKIKNNKIYQRPSEAIEMEQKLLGELRNLQVMKKRKQEEQIEINKMLQYSMTEL